MKIIILTTNISFITLKSKLTANYLCEKIKKHTTYNVEVIKIPFNFQSKKILDQVLALRLIDITAFADLVISLDFPSCMIFHPNKVVWFIDDSFNDLIIKKNKVSKIIKTINNKYLSEANKIFSFSKQYAHMLARSYKIKSSVLLSPFENIKKIPNDIIWENIIEKLIY